MYTVTYYKLGKHWYLDAPDYIAQGGEADDLERIGAFHDFLELAAEGATTVVFHMDTNAFNDADFFELVASSGGRTGGHYHLHSFQGQPVDLELWFNSMIFSGLATLPQRIYFKKVAHSML
ncbi:DUF6717 family protein [Flavisolibacter nicotianae]|uniref:DUF6717 family protein n=1 Tax=Flavisolibacter nicotianae TaxID=2364882 RepID=UPI000EAB7AAD|nr:DUF6717 family protein [Flavisolibacter nicotianae]